MTGKNKNGRNIYPNLHFFSLFRRDALRDHVLVGIGLCSALPDDVIVDRNNAQYTYHPHILKIKFFYFCCCCSCWDSHNTPTHYSESHPSEKNKELRKIKKLTYFEGYVYPRMGGHVVSFSFSVFVGCVVYILYSLPRYWYNLSSRLITAHQSMYRQTFLLLPTFIHVHIWNNGVIGRMGIIS